MSQQDSRSRSGSPRFSPTRVSTRGGCSRSRLRCYSPARSGARRVEVPRKTRSASGGACRLSGLLFFRVARLDIEAKLTVGGRVAEELRHVDTLDCSTTVSRGIDASQWLGAPPASQGLPFLAVRNAVATIEPVAGHDHDHGADRRMLGGALALIVGLLVAEIAVGILAGSLALLADAGHMLTDAAALALALLAAAVATRPPGGSWTFGSRRVEILAALANGITLALVGIWIVYEAVRRLISPTDVRGGLVLVLAGAGIAVNLAAAALLARPSRTSLNIRGAFLHVATDVAAFAGTAIAGALVLVTGWDRFDPLASLAVAALIFWSSATLLRESSRILLDVSPGEMPPEEVAEAMLAVSDVVEVHDLHVWTVGSGFPSLSAHVLVRPEGDCHEARRELAAGS